MSKIDVIHGDCIAELTKLAACSIDSCVTDPPYLLTSIVNRIGSNTAAPVSGNPAYKRISRGFMGKTWDAPGDPLGVSTFEAWLAGFLAGEGCFRIQRHKDGKYYSCSMSVHLRQDDAPLIIGLQKRLGGSIRFGDGRTNKQGIVSSPDIRWVLQTQEECWRLANILDRAPLFGKKAQDYELWRQALHIWSTTKKGNRWGEQRDVSEMATLHDKIKDIKRYNEDIDFNFDPFMPPNQAFHYKWAKEVFRVLKPGAHLLAFSGTRTYHRMAVAIEDAGFEIRDQIGWLYGSGFPKSHDISKAIDRMKGAQREVVGVAGRSRKGGGDICTTGLAGGEYYETRPATEEADRWAGWGTALKPAWEPIVVARKPLSESSIAANVLKHGTGALNIDACRIGEAPGRWPANVCHDGSDEVLAEFAKYHQGIGDSGSAARFFYTAKADKADRLGSNHPTVKPVSLMRWLVRMITPPGGTVLDPFGGSGTTAMAAMAEGFDAILIELEEQSVADIRRRISHVHGHDTPLFEDLEPRLL